MGSLMRRPATAKAHRRLMLPGQARTVADAADSAGDLASDLIAPESAQERLSKAPHDSAAFDEMRSRAERAEDKAARLAEELESLRKAINDEREAARDAGLAEGLEHGRAQALQEASARAGKVESLLASMHEQLSAGLGADEDELVEAVVTATGKMIGKRMATRRGAAAAVRQACRALDKRRRLLLRVAPDDLELLTDDADLTAALGPNARFEADASVTLGGCVVETDDGTIDARLDTQLESLRRVLLRARAKRAEEASPPAKGESS